MYEDEGYKLMGAAFEAYNQLGYGMAEEVYQQCLAIELHLREIPFVARRKLTLEYKGRVIQKSYEPHFFVFNAIVVEIKAVKELVKDHEAQLFNHATVTPARWLPHQLRPERRPRVAPVHPERPARSAGMRNTNRH